MKKLRTTQKIMLATFIVGCIAAVGNFVFILPVYGVIGKSGSEVDATLNRSSNGVHAFQITIFVCLAVTIVTAVIDYSKKPKK